MLKMMLTCFLTVTVSVTLLAQQQPGGSSDELKKKTGRHSAGNR